jgi:uncharacterized protein
LNTEEAIVVFARSPGTGEAKTRLCEELAAAEAAAVHEACLYDTLRLVDALPHSSRWLLLAPPASGATGPASFPAVLGDGWRRGWQRGADLGARLEAAFAELFGLGARKVVAVGTDTPWMGVHRLRLALDWLDRADFVLGPTLDGGYYLIAARRFAPEAFRAIPWGTREVLLFTRRTLERARQTYRLLPVDFDLDRPEDLRRAAELLRTDPTRAPNLARWLERCLENRSLRSDIQRAKSTGL